MVDLVLNLCYLNNNVLPRDEHERHGKSWIKEKMTKYPTDE
jgi:hypothetical protein